MHRCRERVSPSCVCGAAEPTQRPAHGPRDRGGNILSLLFSFRSIFSFFYLSLLPCLFLGLFVLLCVLPCLPLFPPPPLCASITAGKDNTCARGWRLLGLRARALLRVSVFARAWYVSCIVFGRVCWCCCCRCVCVCVCVRAVWSCISVFVKGCFPHSFWPFCVLLLLLLLLLLLQLTPDTGTGTATAGGLG